MDLELAILLGGLRVQVSRTLPLAEEATGSSPLQESVEPTEELKEFGRSARAGAAAAAAFEGSPPLRLIGRLLPCWT